MALAWTLWMRADLYSLPRTEEDTPLGSYWNPVTRSKESSTFDSRESCESAKQTTLSGLRSRQGTYDQGEGTKTTIKVDGDIIVMISQFKEGKGSEQKIQLFCLDKDP